MTRWGRVAGGSNDSKQFFTLTSQLDVPVPGNGGAAKCGPPVASCRRLSEGRRLSGWGMCHAASGALHSAQQQQLYVVPRERLFEWIECQGLEEKRLWVGWGLHWQLRQLPQQLSSNRHSKQDRILSLDFDLGNSSER